MPGKMLFDLTLGFGEKRQVPLVAQRSRGSTDGKRAGVPNRVQQAEATPQLTNPVRAPREMIFLFLGRFPQSALRLLVPRRQRLPLVKRLGADLPHMIDPHEGCGLGTLLGVE